MRIALALAVLAAPAFAWAQDQEASLAAPASGSGAPVYDIVAADRETAWRINRVTGEIIICRIDTTAGLDTVRARCAPAAVQGAGTPGGPQTSSAPGGQGGQP